jgi:hypothetical protein
MTAGSPGSSAASGGAAVSFAGVRKSYRTGAGLPVPALAGVTLDIPAGQVAAVTGRSGSGKSTLLHLAGAMDLPDSGTVTSGDLDLTRLRDRQRAAYRRTIGFVFQRFHLLPRSPPWTTCSPPSCPTAPASTSGPVPPGCSMRSASPAESTTFPRSCPAASSSGSPSPAR